MSETINRFSQVTFEEMCDLIEESEALEVAEVGGVTAHRLRHPVRGEISVIDDFAASSRLVIQL